MNHNTEEKKIIEAKNHEHDLKYCCTNKTEKNLLKIYICSDPECGYFDVYPVTVKVHDHKMVLDCEIQNHCQSYKVYYCDDIDCGYTKYSEYINNQNNCCFDVYKFSTKSNYFKCIQCSRIKID